MPFITMSKMREVKREEMGTKMPILDDRKPPKRIKKSVELKQSDTY